MDVVEHTAEPFTAHLSVDGEKRELKEQTIIGILTRVGLMQSMGLVRQSSLLRLPFAF